ncbi:MAG: endonuclease/exonuclease/phosphatase family protein [Deltaproteobacteria bacterium]|nr:endonuclease/exonuclease/phosphatase family protein [Deltaproteobacteria bacterium]
MPWPLSRHRGVRFRRFSEHLRANSYDLVGIQELWAGARATLSVESLRLPDLRTGDSGLALAGPLVGRASLAIEHFLSAARIDRLKRKGFLRSQVRIGDVDVCVVVTHLQAGRGHAVARRAQVEQLVYALDPVRLPIVVMGDFNFHAEVAEDKRTELRLEEAGFSDIADVTGKLVATYGRNRYVASTEAERLDRIYTRASETHAFAVEELDVVDGVDGPFSDHHPIRARLSLRAR